MKRRKIFIATGTVLTALSISILAWAESVSWYLLPQSTTQSTYRQCSIVIGMLATLSTWTAIQPVNIGLRTLVTKDCSKDEQVKANAWAGSYGNLAAAFVNFTVYVQPNRTTMSNRGFVETPFPQMSIMAMVVLVVSVTISCINIKEVSPGGGLSILIPQREACEYNLRAIWISLFRIPGRVWTIYLVQFLAWLGWFPFLYYAVT